MLTHASRSSSDTAICIQGGGLVGIVSLRQARVRQTLQPSINMLTKIGEGFDFSRLGAESCLTLSLGVFGVEGGDVRSHKYIFFSDGAPLFFLTLSGALPGVVPLFRRPIYPRPEPFGLFSSHVIY